MPILPTLSIRELIQKEQKHTETFTSITHSWVFDNKRFCQIIWQIFTQEEQKKSSKIAPSGLETRTSGSSGNALPTELGSNLLGRRFLKWALFVSCTTSHVGLCRINRAWLYEGHEDSDWQLNVDLAQLVRHWTEDLEVWFPTPLGAIFDDFFLLFPV